MLRHALFLAPFVLLGCASTRTNDLIVSDALATPTCAPSADVLPAESAAPAPVQPAVYEIVGLDLGDPASSEPMPAALVQDESLHGSRFTVKAGYYGGDEDAIDDGWIVNLSWMRFFTRIFALEFEAGYLDADGDDGTNEAELWAIPIFLNGRFGIPIWILEVYAGAGVGGFYYDVETSVAGDDDGFVLGGNAFLGGSFNLADAIALGLEAKYYVSEDADDFDESLEAFALMLTLGFSR